jgi:mTERF domain-containing protein
MFGYALTAFAPHSEKKLAKKIEILVSFGWSQEDLLTAMRKTPFLFNTSEQRLRRNLDFLTRDVALKQRRSQEFVTPRANNKGQIFFVYNYPSCKA